MNIYMQIIYKILTTLCCFVVLAACSSLKTGDLDRGHNTQGTVSVVYDGEQEGRLVGDVEPEPEKTKAQELKDLQLLGKWEQGVPAVEYSDQEVEYDFPVTVNRQVQYYLDFFSFQVRSLSSHDSRTSPWSRIAGRPDLSGHDRKRV